MFLRQVNQLRTLHDINFDIMQKDQMKNNQKQIIQKQNQLLFLPVCNYHITNNTLYPIYLQQQDTTVEELFTAGKRGFTKIKRKTDTRNDTSR